MKLPPRLKPLTPFIKRGDELDRAGDKRSRIMSYFCRSWAMELGIGLNDSTPEVQASLLDIMNRLESDKSTLPSRPPSLPALIDPIGASRPLVFLTRLTGTLPEVNDKEKSKDFVGPSCHKLAHSPTISSLTHIVFTWKNWRLIFLREKLLLVIEI